ncbi:SDR family NAD(P)-dependent oxidoreductase [Sphingobacterium luzhongxinii]|uniref:SDR family NAD(P)-dependent oxidoreductase n=1 Tax=Sphingobacterium luzhongxinii TaxID=2654181 RepID=UPI0013DD615B|nr:SDR family oxidoreductase [Sphingobacterium sp. xlx-73]
MEKVFLVTGATSGIGLATVEKLLSLNFKVYGLGRDKSKVAHLLSNSLFSFVIFDLVEYEKLDSFFKDNFDNIQFSGFVHCAGVEETMPLALYNSTLVERIYKINVFAPIELVRLVSKKKYSFDGCSFVLLSSVMAELGQYGKVGYCSTKSAILGLVRSAALELSKRKIRVNSIAPGIVNTPLKEKLRNKIGEEAINEIEKLHPLGFGNVEDVVPLIEFLLSDGSRWITGQNIKIDGGYSIQ